MSKIDELLKDEKVEWKKLGDIAEIKVISPKRKLKKNEYLDEGLYPIIDQGQNFIVGYTNDNSAIFDKRSYVIFGDHTEILKYVDFQFAQGADGIKVLKTDENYINSRYLYHTILNFYKITGEYKRHFSILKETIIPIPSIETQEKIVQILDKFTNYVTELQTELQARTKQYEYYRDMLLSEEYLNKLSNNPEILGGGYRLKITTLGEICDVRDGTHDSPKKQVQGKYLITSKNIKSGNVNFDNAYYISEHDYNNINRRSKVDIDDLLFTMIGTIGEVAHIKEQPNYAIKNVGLIKNNSAILSRYIFYYLKSTYTKCYIEQNKSKGSQVFISLGNLRMLKLPVPYIPVQEHIVSILDKFDNIVNDISKGLPKEIELRQKRYEYYREKLLSFEK